jgi:transcriptional regulator with XRE-family HTH domain
VLTAVPRPPRELTPDRSPTHRLGAELRAYRVESGHSQKSLGAKVHVSKSMIGAMETGDRLATAAVIRACDEELGASGELYKLWSIAARSRRRCGRPTTSAFTTRTPAGATPSASVSPIALALAYVERVWAVRVDRARIVQGLDSIASATDRGTWVRLERLHSDAAAVRGWGGVETAALAVPGVAAPQWINTLTWRANAPGAVWRAEEVEYVSELPVGSSSAVDVDPRLSPAWWSAWGSSLDALADARTSRIALARRQPVTTEHVTRVIESVWPGRVSSRVSEWAGAHGDMTWRKLTSPVFWILDWDGFGIAPRGLDAATLWANSLAVPNLATQVWRERATDLESPTGRVMALFCLARLLCSSHAQNGLLRALAAREASALLSGKAQVS